MKPKIYIRNFNGVLDGVIKSEEFERVDDPRSADALVLWQDVRGEFKELVQINKEHLHKPLVVVQHGAGATRDYEHPENFPFMADKFCCWGQADMDRLIKQGNGDKGVITGCSLINQIKPQEKEDGKNIVFCPIVAEHEEPSNLMVYYELKKMELDYSQKNIVTHRKELEKIWRPSVFDGDETLGEHTIPYMNICNNLRLISKLTPMHDKALYSGSVVQTNVVSPTHIADCVKLLTHTSVVVGMVESTFQMLAMAMGIPVVICKEWEFKMYGGKDYTNCDHIKTKGATYCDLKDLRKVIEGELADPQRLTKERQEVVLREFGDINSDPDKKIIEVIKGVCNG